MLVAAGAGALAAAGGWRFWPEQGMVNPCLAPLPPHLARHDLVQAAWNGLDPAQVWDAHVHLIATGDAASGASVNPDLASPLHPVAYAQRLFFANASCAAPGLGFDAGYLERLKATAAMLPRGARIVLLALDRCHAESGEALPERSTLHVPNEYAHACAQASPERFEWIASIHPYRPDAIEALEWARAHGARAVKWIPNAQGMDPASARCERFYAALQRAGLPLLSHAGLQRAVRGVDIQSYGNPLRLRRALDAGVRVIVAHCATMGEDHDLDAGPNGPARPGYALFGRLMNDARYANLVHGDISALPQSARAWALPDLIERTEWHGRLLNGSDYPLPGIMPLYSIDELVDRRLLDRAAAPVLTEIRRHDALLFDFVLKRTLRSNGRAFGNAVFETARILAPEAARPGAAPA